jgi:hypothetical protein
MQENEGTEQDLTSYSSGRGSNFDITNPPISLIEDNDTPLKIEELIAAIPTQEVPSAAFSQLLEYFLSLKPPFNDLKGSEKITHLLELLKHADKTTILVEKSSSITKFDIAETLRNPWLMVDLLVSFR